MRTGFSCAAKLPTAKRPTSSRTRNGFVIGRHQSAGVSHSRTFTAMFSGSSGGTFTASETGWPTGGKRKPTHGSGGESPPPESFPSESLPPDGLGAEAPHGIPSFGSPPFAQIFCQLPEVGPPTT